MKATFENSFCTDSDCINNFEYMCMVALSEKGTEIEPQDMEDRDSGYCPEFKAGTFLIYEVDLGEEDFE